MTAAPEKIWADCFAYGDSKRTQFHAGTNVAIPVFSRTEYLRRDLHTAYLADYRAAYEGSCLQVELLQAEVVRLRLSLKSITQRYDPSHHGEIAEDMNAIALAALAHE
jgi:hypothetical protein